MSSFPPPPAEEPLNPYAAPITEIGPVAPSLGADITQAESIRRAYLNHEASVKAIGSLGIFGAIVLGIFAAVFLAAAAGVNVMGRLPFNQQEGTILAVGLGVFFLGLAALGLFVGIGLRRLQPWARWTETALIALQIMLNLITVGLGGQ